MMKGNKHLFITIALSIVLGVAHYINSKLLIMVALIGLTVLPIVAPFECYLPFMLFYLTWSGVMRTTPSSYSFYTIIQVLFFLRFVFHKSRLGGLRCSNYSLIGIASVIIVSLLGNLSHVASFSLGYMVFIMMIIFVPFYMTESLDFEQCALYYVIGTVTASFAELFFLKTPHMSGFASVDEHVQIGISRISGLSGDSNGYAGELLAAFCCAAILIFKYKGSFYKKIMLAVSLGVFCYFGFMTLSKMFIILLIIVVAILLLLLVADSKVKHKSVWMGLIVVAAVFFLSMPQTEALWQMYQVRFSTSSDSSALFSGRNVIWLDYIEYLLSHFDVLLIGNGLNRAVTANGYAAHNTIIQIIFQLGFLGTVGLVFWYKGLSAKRKNTNLNAGYIFALAIALFVPWLSLDKLFFDDFFFLIMLFAVSKKASVVREDYDGN